MLCSITACDVRLSWPWRNLCGQHVRANNANQPDRLCPLPPPAVRFGRIPKREKQRLLDEMQSYMNSLNESAAMEMESAVMRDTPAAPIDGNSKEAIGAISRAYRDIFTSSHNSCPERSAKRANIPVTNNNTYHFSQDASFPQGSSQPISAQTYQSCPVAPASLCPVAPNNNQHAFHHGDNNQHAYPVSTNQSHNQYNNATHQKSNSANESSIQNAANNQNQPSCPWKLAPGAKVLVRTWSIWHHVKSSVRSFERVLTLLSFLKACPLNAWPVSGAERTSQEIWESFSQCFTPAVKEVVEFAKGIPGFQELSQQDQVMLLKSGTFQVTAHY